MNFTANSAPTKTHESTTEPEARLARRETGRRQSLASAAHATEGEPQWLARRLRVSEANGTPNVTRPSQLVEMHRFTADHGGGDKGYGASEFVEQCRLYGITHTSHGT